MHAIARIAAVLLLAVSAGRVHAAEFNAEVEQAGEKVKEVFPDVSRRMTEGDYDGANSALLALFPAANRTAAQSFLLGNILFEADRKDSYALHQAAAKMEPNNQTVQWEWAFELHRAGDYAGALAAYQAYSKANPQSSVPYGLAADCLLRLNRIDEAADAWAKSEAAPRGNLETFESMVCAVHREPAQHQHRAELLAKVIKAHDGVAAAELIALDCDFPEDWWNGGPQKEYLAHDAPAVAAALKLPPEDPLGRALACAAECALEDPEDAAKIKAILLKYRMLIDADHTVPANGGLLWAILKAATASKSVDDATIHDQIGPKVLALAKAGNDKRLWNIALFSGPQKPAEMLPLERAGWKATGDSHFAFGVLYINSQAAPLKLDDPDLQAALKQFPEDGLIQRAAYEAAIRESKVSRELLANAAKAEFTHFSSFVAPATVVNRPRSDYLRGYFKRLKNMPAAATKPAA